MCENSEVLMLKLDIDGATVVLWALTGAWTFNGQAHFDLNDSILSWGQNHSFLRVGEGTWELHSNNARKIICPCEITSRAVSCPWAASPYPWKRARCSHHVNQCDFHWHAWVRAHLHHRRMEVVGLFFFLKLSLVVFLDIYLDMI